MKILRKIKAIPKKKIEKMNKIYNINIIKDIVIVNFKFIKCS